VYDGIMGGALELLDCTLHCWRRRRNSHGTNADGGWITSRAGFAEKTEGLDNVT